MPDTMIPADLATALHSITPSVRIKKRATAAEIQAELQARIDRLAARDAEFRGCTASSPRPSQVRNDGAPNWTVDGFPNLPSGGFGRMVQLLDQTRREFELVG